MDCKTCKNYEPKAPSYGVKTANLKVGMILQVFRHLGEPTGEFLVVIKPPSERSMRFVSIKDTVLRKRNIFLSDLGCQPDLNGEWKPCHLQEIT